MLLTQIGLLDTTRDSESSVATLDYKDDKKDLLTMPN